MAGSPSLAMGTAAGALTRRRGVGGCQCEQRPWLSAAPAPWHCLGPVGCKLQREVLCSCNALFLEGGFVAIVWHNDRERHRFSGTAELNDDVDQRLGPSWIRAITDHLRVNLHRHYAASYTLKGDRPRSPTVRQALWAVNANGKGA